MLVNETDTSGLQADLDLIRDAAREGGEIARRYFGNDPETWYKEGMSPVSAADIAVDEFLRKTLMAARPEYGWLSEETADNKERLAAKRTFIVDPIDGTRAFLEGKSTWCVSVAVVENGVSLVGVLDCPIKNEVYEASLGGYATCNGNRLSVASRSDAPPRIAGPKPMLAVAPDYMRHGPDMAYVPSLAYRVAMVASGALDATFVKPNAHDWDLAAADLILKQAGGNVLNEDGAPLYYASSNPRHGALVAGSGELLRDMAEVIASMKP